MNKKFLLILSGFILASSLVLTIFLVQLPEKQPLISKQTIEEVKEEYESKLMAIDGVVGVGISECEGKPCIEVYLTNSSSNLKQQIPVQLDGFPVYTEVTGAIEAFPQK